MMARVYKTLKISTKKEKDRCTISTVFNVNERIESVLDYSNNTITILPTSGRLPYTSHSQTP